jgi:hypothetical protein
MKKILLGFGLLFLSSVSLAAGVPASFTYQGIVMNSAGTAPLTSVVSLKLSIYDPTGSCLLYQEQQANIDLSQTNGTFAVQVGSAVGSAKRVGVADQGLAMTSVFANNGQILAPSTTGCTAGYTPASADIRLLRVSVTNGGSTVTITPDLQINSVPNSLVAETLQGFTPTQLFHAPTVTVLTSSSGIYTVPAGTKYLQVEMVGGGGGGGGSGTGGAASTGSNGGVTTFGTALLSATGGTGANGSTGNGGPGGTVTVNSPATQIAAYTGNGGGGSTTTLAGADDASGGMGGSSPFGGVGPASYGASTPPASVANSGSGGSGSGSGGAAGAAGGGGGAGGYIRAIINNPAATYNYTIGTAGSGGPANSGGAAGAAGGSGVIVISAY